MNKSRSKGFTEMSAILEESFDAGHEGEINDAKMDYTGIKLATASSDKSVRIFSFDHKSRGYHQRASLTGYTGPVWQVAWSHICYGGLLATASYDGRIIIWKEEEDSPEGVMQARWSAVYDEVDHFSSVNSVAWCSENFGAILAAGSSDGTISILTLTESNDWAKTKITSAHELGCQSVSWSPVEKCLASGGNDNNVKIWKNSESDADRWVLEHSLRGHVDWVFTVEWSPYEEILVSASQDGKILLWNKAEEQEKPRWNHSSSSISINVSQCSDEADDSATKWVHRVLQFYSKGTFSVSWDPMGIFVCVAGDKDDIYMWKRSEGDRWICTSKAQNQNNSLV